MIVWDEKDPFMSLVVIEIPLCCNLFKHSTSLKPPNKTYWQLTWRVIKPFSFNKTWTKRQAWQNNKIHIADVKCPKLYPTPYARIDCPYGYRTGFYCNITCDAGKTMFGSEFVVCDKSIQGLFGAWNWQGGQQTTCKSEFSLFSVRIRLWFISIYYHRKSFK